MKTIICPCEDITKQEVVDAIHDGYDTIEDVKRYTGLSTGTCQGALCLGPLVELLVRTTDRSADSLGTIRHRPPVEPVPLGLLAAGAREESS